MEPYISGSFYISPEGYEFNDMPADVAQRLGREGDWCLLRFICLTWQKHSQNQKRRTYSPLTGVTASVLSRS